MRNFNHDHRANDRGRGSKRFGDRNSDRRNYDSGKPAMHQAICAECGKSCEVPFKPTDDRPVFCSECFEAKERKGGKKFGGRNSGGHGFADRDSRQSSMFRATCAECGQSCEVPFEPRDGRPVYCSNCFENKKTGDRNFRRPERSNSGRSHFEEKSQNQEQFKGQFDILNTKLDKILQMLKPDKPIETAPKVEVKKEETKKKVKAEKPKKVTKKAPSKKKE